MGGIRFVVRATAATAAMALLGALAVGAPSVPVAADGNEAPGSPTSFEHLTLGGSAVCVVNDAGALRCWGQGANGRLGSGDTANRGDEPGEMGAFLPTVDVGSGRTVSAVAGGRTFMCAVLDDGSLKCWGSGNSGQLGQGNTASIGDNPNEMGDDLPAIALGTGRTATAVTGGVSHTCALLDNAKVKCWGDNAYGQLGQGDTTRRGEGPNEMGDNLPTVALGTGRTATAITAGETHVCALMDNGRIKCWGRNTSGELGLGDTANRGDGPTEMGGNLPAVALGTGRTATAISAGYDHVCALLDDGSIKCWGNNLYGQLGLGDVNHRGDGPNEMGDNLPAVDLGAGRTATAVAAMTWATCALLDNGAVKCWGRNLSGQLGLGNAANRGDGPNEMGDSLPVVNLGTGRTATVVTAGGQQACARLDNGALKCWGENLAGTLGQEDTATRGDSATEMGDNLPAVFLPPAGLMGGTITDAVTGLPVVGAGVIALRTSDFGTAASATTDAAGNYLMQAPTGTYFLYLVDPTGSHADGFLGAPQQVTVTDGAAIDTDGTMAGSAARGAFSGTVTDQATGAAVPGAIVYAIGASGIAGGTVTASNGTYILTGLVPGTYRAVFVNGSGRRVTEYWNNSPNYDGAATINVSAGTTTPNVNAALFRP
ncbi:MAG: carboxypeptidase regulatory-like domain-containing protein [Acidimicrobiales bacterium]|nr:carboxypeptidase regulatory-like domain-containing protein [Acidimicrobiales bacterium]